MTRIKFCGLKRIEDIQTVNQLLPDYIGFVFWQKRPWNIVKKTMVLRIVNLFLLSSFFPVY